MSALRAILVCLGALTTGSAVSAQVIGIECGATWYSFQPKNNFLEMADRNDTVDWQYDGEWLRLTSQTDGSKLAFSSKNGYRIIGGKQEAAGCVFKDTDQLALLPVSEGAQLRLAFLALSEEKRKEVQRNLAQDGYYRSTIDGLWGSGTEAAIMALIKALEAAKETNIELKTAAGANQIVSTILSRGGNENECINCDAAPKEDVGERTQASIYKNSGLDCRKNASALGGHDGGRSVMLYVRQSEWSFDDDRAMKRQLKSLISQYPNHPALNWQAGWLSFLNNDFENTIKHLKVAAFQGEPNAAFMLAYIGLGLLDGEDSLKPDASIKLKPIELPTVVQCLEAVVTSDNILVYDGGMYQSQFVELATSFLAALYLHDIGDLFEERGASINLNYTGVPYNPVRALNLANTLDPQNYRELINSAKAAVQRKDDEQKRLQKEQQRQHEESLKLPASDLARLEKKCEGYSTIKGICWSLSLPEMRSMLASREYRNNPAVSNEFTDVKGAKITLLDDRVVFECGILNVCDLSIRELASQIQKSGLVNGSMEFDTTFSGGLIEGVSSSSSSLCGRGKQGEKICAIETTSSLGALSFKNTSLVLAKGIVGKTISFD